MYAVIESVKYAHSLQVHRMRGGRGWCLRMVRGKLRYIFYILLLACFFASNIIEGGGLIEYIILTLMVLLLFLGSLLSSYVEKLSIYERFPLQFKLLLLLVIGCTYISLFSIWYQARYHKMPDVLILFLPAIIVLLAIPTTLAMELLLRIHK